MTRNLPFCLAPTTPQLQINYIKFTQTLVTSSYVPNEDVWKVFLKTKECEKSEIIIIQTLRFKKKTLTFSQSQHDSTTPDKLY